MTSRDEALSLAVILPALNEAAALPETLAALAPLKDAGAEILVVDGGSTDGTLAAASQAGVRTVVSARGRALQMNAGAGSTTAALLVFLHADTRLSAPAMRVLCALAAAPAPVWGRFDVRLTGRHPAFRIIERMINVRSRLSGIATGDQAIFVHRSLFEAVGGFPCIPLMEDVALSKALRGKQRPLCLRETVTTDARRWETRGIFRTVLLMWGLRGAYALGVAPERLARFYRNVR